MRIDVIHGHLFVHAEGKLLPTVKQYLMHLRNNMRRKQHSVRRNLKSEKKNWSFKRKNWKWKMQIEEDGREMKPRGSKEWD